MYVQGILSRAYGLPIERPKSVTMEWLIEKYGKLDVFDATSPPKSLSGAPEQPHLYPLASLNGRG